MARCADHLVCACCGGAIADPFALLRQQTRQTRRDAVYAYELTVLGAQTWCYLATAPDGSRFDLVLANAVLSEENDSSRVCRSRRPYAYTAQPFDDAVRFDSVFIVENSSSPTAENSWFPGYEWQAVFCSECEEPPLLGWAFTPDKDSDLAGAVPFFGLLLTRLRERPVPLPTLGLHGVSSPAHEILMPAMSDARDPSTLWPMSRQRLASSILPVTSVSRPQLPQPFRSRGAADAARGRGLMPPALLPSMPGQPPASVEAEASQRTAARRSSAAAARRLPLAAEEGEGSSSGEEAEDFQLQRANARRTGLERARPSVTGWSGRLPQQQRDVVGSKLPLTARTAAPQAAPTLVHASRNRSAGSAVRASAAALAVAGDSDSRVCSCGLSVFNCRCGPLAPLPRLARD
mmetsp:Transcript_57342/g.167857  ORF Transcript_57342/g.167857 Transcript_57342/m.167857 type:complete len:405 (+) Transcript_57342:146-1360(+)